MTQLRTASKHILYAVANSLAMNGISSSAKVVQVMPAWQTWMIALDVVVGVLALVGVVLLVKKTQWKKV
jgi:beta-glucosidase